MVIAWRPLPLGSLALAQHLARQPIREARDLGWSPQIRTPVGRRAERRLQSKRHLHMRVLPLVMLRIAAASRFATVTGEPPPPRPGCGSRPLLDLLQWCRSTRTRVRRCGSRPLLDLLQCSRDTELRDSADGCGSRPLLDLLQLMPLDTEAKKAADRGRFSICYSWWVEEDLCSHAADRGRFSICYSGGAQ